MSGISEPATIVLASTTSAARDKREVISQAGRMPSTRGKQLKAANHRATDTVKSSMW